MVPVRLAPGLLAMAACLTLTPVSAQIAPDDLFLEPITNSISGGALGVRHANDGSGRKFVIGRAGQIHIIDADDELLADPFLDIIEDAPPLGFGGTGGERGLLGLAFHPLYATNGRFFIGYIDGNGDTAVVEYAVSDGNPDLADPASGQVVLRVYQPASNHNGGDLQFGSDGYLYISLGDGGPQNNACTSAQALVESQVADFCTPGGGDAFLGTPPAGVPQGNANAPALLGKILRIDIDSTTAPAGSDRCGTDPGTPTYGIPADNPFAGDSGSNAAACDEIFHLGLRNPYRFSFDRDTFDIIIGDVGQGSWEEVNLVGASEPSNFQWSACEGFNNFGSSTPCTFTGGEDPIIAYPHGGGTISGFSITGGYRYRGPREELEGLLFFADLGSKIFIAEETTPGAWDVELFSSSVNQPVGFGEDELGRIYVTTLGGSVSRFELPPIEPPLEPEIFANGFEGNDRSIPEADRR